MENNYQEINTGNKLNNDANQINRTNSKGLVAHGGTNYFADNINIANQPIPIERERLEKKINQINDEFINKEKDRRKRKEKEEDRIKENFQTDVEEIEKETEQYKETLAEKLCYDLSVLDLLQKYFVV